MSSSAAARLCRAHLLTLGPDADSSVLADVIWLGLQLALHGAAAPDGTVSAEDRETPQNAPQPSQVGLRDGGAQAEPAAKSNVGKSDSLVPLYPSYFTHPFGKSGASRINIPAGDPLPQRLHLERALKPFKRRVLSRQQRELDPIATAEASAEWRAITPVYRASPERWFEVAILAESNDAMHVWDATLLELQRTLARHGAFRHVRLWRYTIRKDKLILSTASAAVASPRTLVDPQGRRLCWFVTTGTSSLWRHAALTDLVAMLGQSGPTAIVQLMPYHTWPHTLLGDASEEALAQAPGTPTARLRLRDPFTGKLEHALNALTVPVTSLEPARLAAWARFSMATHCVQHPAIRVPRAQQTAISSPVPRVDAASPRQRIAAFRAVASPQAFQLLRLLSGMPLSLPVMRLMQMGMPDRAQFHLAEVLLSGLIERITPPDPDLPSDLVEYDFVPGIRDALLDSLTLSEENRIEASVSKIAEEARRFIEEYAGSANASFPALVRDPIGDERLLDQAKSFLSVTQSFRPLLDRELLGLEEQGGAQAIPTSSRAVKEKAGFEFLTENAIKEHVLRAGVIDFRGTDVRCLLFFASDRRHSWLVASDHEVAVLLDDAGTRRSEQLVQRTNSWLDALPVTVRHELNGESVINFGVSDPPGWNYSASLFSPPEALEDAVVAMVPGGRDGLLMQLRGSALAYDKVRSSVSSSSERTYAMQGIVDEIAAMRPLSDPDIALATQSRSPGIQLLAIVSLQRNFDWAYTGWLFDCIASNQAFLAFQAALTIQRAMPTLSIQKRETIKKRAIDTKRKLLAVGLDDINVHRLLDEFSASHRAKRSSKNGRRILRIQLGSTGWELANYRTQAVQLLERLGHEVVDEPVIESVPELQTRLSQFEACDMVLFLIGTRNEYVYSGKESDSDRMLLVELEYRTAQRLSKPMMVFMLKDELVSGETRGQPARMERFRQMLLRNHMVQMVQTPGELEEVLHRAIYMHAMNFSEKVEDPGRGLGREPDDNRHTESLPGAATADSAHSELDPAEEVDEFALTYAFSKAVSAGALPDLNGEIESALDHAVESAQWDVDAESYLFYEQDGEYGQLLRWEFAPPSQPEFKLSKYVDGTLFVTSNILAWVEVHCSFNFSVKDYVDKDMVPVGYTNVNQTIEFPLKVEIAVRGVVEGQPELESVEVESISESVDFGSIEPDADEDSPGD